MESINNLIRVSKNIRTQEDINNFNNLIKPYLNNKEYVLALLEKNVIYLRDVSDELKSDREVVLTAVKRTGWNFTFADPKFFDDKEIALVAVKNGSGVSSLSDNLKNDDEIALIALKNSVFEMKNLPLKHKDNKDLIMSLKVFCLDAVSDRLKSDRDVVLMSVSAVGEYLEFASKELQDDAEIALAAVKNSASKTAMPYVSERLKSDVKIAKAAIRNFWDAVEYLSEDGKNNKEIILSALKKDGMYFKDASPNLKRDPEVILTALMNAEDGWVIPLLDKDLKDELGNQEPVSFFESKLKSKKKKIKP